MSRMSLIDSLAGGRPSRRQLARMLAAAGLSLMALPLAPRRSRAANLPPVYFTWDGYNDLGFFPGYVDKHGQPPVMQTFLDQDEAFNSLSSGLSADLIHPCSERVRRWRDAGLLQPIDTDRIAGWADVAEPLKTIVGVQADGQQWFVPIDWGNTSVLYRADLVDIAEESWTLLWDERYAKRISVGEDDTDTVVIAGLLAGARDPYDMTDAELGRVRDLLLKQAPLNSFYWVDQTTMEQSLASGEIVASVAWNASFAALKKQGVPVKYMTPKEGIITWCCGLVLSKTATEVDKAYDLMNAMLSPQAGKWLIENLGYGHSNRKAYGLVDQAVLEGLGLPRDPEIMLSNSLFTREMARPDTATRLFEELRSTG